MSLSTAMVGVQEASMSRDNATMPFSPAILDLDIRDSWNAHRLWEYAEHLIAENERLKRLVPPLEPWRCEGRLHATGTTCPHCHRSF
jgi:hypothetical protein